MRFEVPQFIDVEEKLFGPLTFKQAIYLAGGVGLGYVCYKIIPSPLSYIFALVFVALGLLLAFYKMNNRSFMEIAQSYLNYQIKGKRYIWKRDLLKKPSAPVAIPQPPKETISKNITNQTITDLAKNLDILDQK
jgi:hypothetical protein